MMDWEDLRHVLAVGRHRTLSEAARKLGVNHSTVYRRIRRIEAGLGVQLFEKHRDGYVATSAGEEALRLAERIEDETASLEANLEGHAAHLSGSIRITTTDTLWATVLPPACAGFCETHPDIRLEIVISNEFVNLNKRHADVAIRPATSPQSSLFGRKACDIALSVYGSKSYFAAIPQSSHLSKHRWLVPDDSLGYSASEKWLTRKVPNPNIAIKLNSVLGMCNAAQAGLGVATLPLYVGDACPELQRLNGVADDLRSELWLLTHRELRHVARIRAFITFMGRYLRRKQKTFEGIAETSTSAPRCSR